MNIKIFKKSLGKTLVYTARELSLTHVYERQKIIQFNMPWYAWMKYIPTRGRQH